jgi:pyruvate dehydrogenase E1 component beta subunit
LKVLAPGTVNDARYMLGAALDDPNPVIIFEHAMLLAVEGEVNDARDDFCMARAAVRRQGSDVSLITYGGSLPKTLAAAEQLAADGIQAEVIDLRSLRPLDMPTVIQSVSQTHRALIVDEGWRTCSLAAEVSAGIMEGAFYELDAPVARICTAEVPLPYAGHLEDAALPQTPRIVATVKEMLARHD